MTGKRFGKWTVIEQAEPLQDKRGHNIIRWRCVCDCGSQKDVIGTSLRSGKSASCGCNNERRKEVAAELFTTHGESKDRLYKIWIYMKRRCLNPNVSNYANYGGRGISICEEWLDYGNFKEWAIKNGYGESLSIDRINVNGCYEPNNCRWVTSVAQANNKRNTFFYTYEGITKSVADWAREYNINYKTLYKRLKSGKIFSEAIKH